MNNKPYPYTDDHLTPQEYLDHAKYYAGFRWHELLKKECENMTEIKHPCRKCLFDEMKRRSKGEESQEAIYVSEQIYWEDRKWFMEKLSELGNKFDSHQGLYNSHDKIITALMRRTDHIIDSLPSIETEESDKSDLLSDREIELVAKLQHFFEYLKSIGESNCANQMKDIFGNCIYDDED